MSKLVNRNESIPKFTKFFSLLFFIIGTITHLTAAEELPFGSLEQIQYFESETDGPAAITYSPLLTVNGSKKLYAAVSTLRSANVSVYEIDITTGVFTRVQSYSHPGSGNSASLAFSQTITDDQGVEHVFLAAVFGGSNILTVYELNKGTGALSFVPGSPINLSGNAPSSVAFSSVTVANKLFAGVSNSGYRSTDKKIVSIYEVDKTTGAFVFKSEVSTGSGAQGFAFSPQYKGNIFGALVGLTSATISGYGCFSYKQNSATGALVPVTGSPFDTRVSCSSLAFTPIMAYKKDNGSRQRTLFTGIVPATGSRYDFFTVYEFSFNSGALKAIQDVLDVQTPLSIAYSPVVIDSAEKSQVFAAIGGGVSSGQSGTPLITLFTVDPKTGYHTKVQPPAPVVTPSPVSLAFSPFIRIDGEELGKLFLATVNSNDNHITVFNVILRIIPPVRYVTLSQEAEVDGVVIRSKQTGINYINVIKWGAPRFSTVDIAAFRVLNGKTGKVIAEVPNRGQKKFKIKINNKSPCKTYKYGVISVGRDGDISSVVEGKLKGRKCKKNK